MSYETMQQAEASPGQIVERLVRFDGPPDQFLVQLLALQCHVGGAESGAILRLRAAEDGQGRMEVISIFPALETGAATAPVWLSQAGELAGQVISSKRVLTTALRTPDDMYGAAPGKFLVLLPIWGRSGVRGVASFVVPNSGPVEVEHSVQRLELTVTLLSLYELRLTLQQRALDLGRLRKACEVLSAVNDQRRYKAAAMALCNHIASAFNAERVGVGLLRGRYVKLQALSHTEKFTRKMELVQSIESAMEECLDQDAEVLYPAPQDAATVNRSARELSQRNGHGVVIALPLRLAGQPVGVLSVERPADRPLELEEVEALRVTCDLCTARIVELSEHDCWFGAKMARGAKKGLGALVGPRHTWAKVAAVAVAGFLTFVTFVHGTYRVEAPFVAEAIQRQVIAAPFDSYLDKVHVEPGKAVEGGVTVLAELDTSELQKQRVRAQAEFNARQAEANIQQTQNKIRELEVTRAELQRIAEDIHLLDWKISQAAIRSPIGGIVTSGDLMRELGAPVRRGQMLFEVAPMELRAELSVREDRIADVEIGQKGLLAAVSHPGDYIPFEVEHIDPVAEVVDQKNVFRVRVKLEESRPWMRPGMEGVAKIDVDQRPYGVIWTRELVNWIRMKLWI